ncbi:T9SS type A sorting domain-containing protein [Flavobacterium sp.]|uniref:T9SS type A sorting domain-containing protein n=1 Tax=Flavobacterium sp. TaxID=239 RepID=UPI004047F082
MKKSLLYLFTFVSLLCQAQVTQYYSALPAASATSANSRAPQGLQRYSRTVYVITAAEMATSGLSNGDVISAIGFSYATAQNIPTTGNFIVYMENTSDVTNTKSTDWTTAITGMTTVSNSSITIPAQTGQVNFPFSGGSPFTYTGNGVYIAFEYQNPTSPVATVGNVANCTTTIAAGLKSAQSTTVLPTTLGASNWRPETFLGKEVSCVSPSVFYLPDYLSTSSADLYWDQPTIVPSTYDIDWSNTFSTPAGSGTLVSAPAGALSYSTGNISGLTPSSNFRYYVRANCGASQSSWSGPFYGYLPVSLPYSNNFENPSNNYTDGFINFTLFNSTALSTPANYADGGAGLAMYTFNSTTAASDSRAYFRGVNLTAGEIVTIEFKTRLYSATTAEPMTFNLTVGASQSALDQTTIIQSYTNSNAAAYTTHTATFTAPSTGIFYFGIHNNTPQATVQTFLFLDSIILTTNLSSADNSLSEFSVYPNPVTTSLMISNPNNVEVKNISITDVNGRMVKNQQGALTQINVSDLNAGVYFVTIEASEGKTTKKFIKQ